MRILITGGAGFIGSHLAERLMAESHKVTILDNFDPFYDRGIKTANLAILSSRFSFNMIEGDIRFLPELGSKLNDNFDAIIHLAGKAGVRPAIADPIAYQDVNVRGTQYILEFARERGIKQVVFASSSSVYGINPNVPWRETDHVLLPISPYASTKVSGELLGHVYSHLYGIRFVALRFFTVYGPRQRPDLAIHKFARSILDGVPISIFGGGTTRRDYTFVGDIVNGIVAALSYERSNYELINVGNHQAISLEDMISTIEEALGMKAKRVHLPEQAGDVPQTYADISKAQRLLGYAPQVSFRSGIDQFVSWLRSSSPTLS